MSGWLCSWPVESAGLLECGLKNNCFFTRNSAEHIMWPSLWSFSCLFNIITNLNTTYKLLISTAWLFLPHILFNAENSVIPTLWSFHCVHESMIWKPALLVWLFLSLWFIYLFIYIGYQILEVGWIRRTQTFTVGEFHRWDNKTMNYLVLEDCFGLWLNAVFFLVKWMSRYLRIKLSQPIHKL